MEYSFTCNGHQNITSKHKTTLEFTKDKEVNLEGDCIIVVSADFNLDSIKKFINEKPNKDITIIIQIIKSNKKIIEKIKAEINPDFNSEKEMVIRKTDFISERTLAIRADKAACDLSKELLSWLKNPERFKIILE